VHTLHLDATFHNFVQGDLSVSDYCHKTKSMTDSLGNLGCVVSNHNLILNVLQGLNTWYDQLRTIITHSTLFLTFHKVGDELVLEEITLGSDTLADPPQAFYSNNNQAPLPLLNHVPLTIAARVKDKVTVMVVVTARVVEAAAVAL
jgi:hypothetical protein